MERRVNYLLIGSLFFLIVLALIVFILWFGRIEIYDDKTIKYTIITEDDISGIAPKTPIKYKGIVIGSISDIGFEDRKNGLVKILLSINKDIPINKGSSLVVDAQGLAGLNYLALKQNPNSEVITQEADRILTLEKSALSKIVNQAEQIVSSVSGVLSEENINNLNQTIASLNLFSRQLTTIGYNLNQTLESTSTLMRAVSLKIDNGQFDLKTMLSPTLEQAEQSFQNLDSVMKKTSNLIDKFNQNPYSTLFGEQK